MKKAERLPFATVALREEQDVVVARRHARELAAQLGLDDNQQTRLAAAVSELARQAFRPPFVGAVTFAVLRNPRRPGLEVRVSAYPSLAERPKPSEQAPHREALIAARRLVGLVEIDHDERGDVVVLQQELPGATIDTGRLQQLASSLQRPEAGAILDELRRQNDDLVRVLQALTDRQDELQRVNHELEDTNRGVLALYAELDESAERLRRASEFKTRFLRHVTHEFRTPLHSILALARLLLERLDGDLTTEQERQVRLIVQAANDLSEIADDLLDLAKVEAGRLVLKPVTFEVRDLFGALRGLMRPLVGNDAVPLTFHAPDNLPALRTDEAKLSQILRNLISNAIKFTEAGRVDVAASYDEGRDAMVFTVSDTGIGIAPEDQERIFVEFSQLDHPIQKKVRGTGLGLPLSRRLAQLLGGSLVVASTPGVGSTFTATVARVLAVDAREAAEDHAVGARPPRVDRVLIVDDDEPWRYVLRRALEGMATHIAEGSSGVEALQAARHARPDVLVLDLGLPDGDGWFVLEQLQGDPDLRSIPVVVVTQQTLTPERAALLNERGVPVLSKANVWPRPELLAQVVSATAGRR